MSVEVSTLAVKVESSGITATANALTKMTAAADAAEKSVGKLTSTVAVLLTQNTSGIAQAWSASLGGLTSSIASLNAGLAATIQALGALQPAMNGNITLTQRHTQATRDWTEKSGVMANTLKAMTTAALAYASVNFAESIIKSADAWTLMQARLEIATGSMHNARIAQEDLYQIAQKARIPLDGVVTLYTRLAPVLQQAGKSAAYAKDMVEGISDALLLGHATGTEMQSVIIQLSQAFSAGKLSGQEFNSVSHNGSVIMRALEASTGKTTAELKKMGSEGKLSIEVVGKAIQDNLPKWQEQILSLPVTFDGAMTSIKNAWSKAIGEVGLDTGFNTSINKALISLSTLLPGIAKEIGNAFVAVTNWIVQNKQGLEEIYNELKLITSQVWEIGGDFFAWIASLAGASSAAQGVAIVITGIRIAVGAIGDAFLALGRPLAQLGLWLYEVFVGTFVKAQEVISKIEMSFVELVASRAKAAFNSGDTEKAQELANTVKNIVNNYSDANFATAQYKRNVDSIGKIIWGQGDAWKANTFYMDQALNASKEMTEQQRIQKENAYDIAKLIALHPDRMSAADWKANKDPKGLEDIKLQQALNNEEKKYENMMANIAASMDDQLLLKERLAAKGNDYDKISPAQKELDRMNQQLAKLQTTKVPDKANAEQQADMAMAIYAQEKLVAIEDQNAESIKLYKTQQQFIDQQDTLTKSAQAQAILEKQKLDTYGQQKGAIEALKLADAQKMLADLDTTSDGQRGDDFEKRIGSVRAYVAALQDIATTTAQIGSQNAQKEFDKLMDPKKAEKFGAAIAQSFGTAGKAIGGLITAMGKYSSRQSEIVKAQKTADSESDPTKKFAMNQQIIKQTTENQLASYAEMAGAAKDFFEKGSTGYKVMQAAEQTFRAFQMAMDLEAFLQKNGLLAASTAAFVTAKATETTTEIASVAPHVEAEQVKTGANAITALTSALAAPFPANIPAFAAVAAILIGLGVAINGMSSGGASVSAQRQAAQGTGTVLGDSDKKSDSLQKALDSLDKNSDISLRYSQGMLSSLQNIEYSLSNATTGVIRSSSVTGKNYQNSSDMFGGVGGTLGATVIGGIYAPILKLASSLPLIGNLVSKLVGAFFGSSSTLKDAGLIGKNQSISDILESGFSVQGYQDVQTKKKAFGITYSDKTNTNLSNVDPSIGKEFSNIIEGMVGTLSSAAGALGMNVDDVKAKLESMHIDIGKISLQGLSSDEVQKQLQAVFSAIGDTLATAALPSIAKFQQAGEGLLETAVRVASGVETANAALDKLGIAAVQLGDVVNTGGDIGAEIVRQSIMVVEAGTSIGDIVQTLSGAAGDIADTYTSLLKARNSLKLLHIADDVSVDLIKAAGGLDTLQNSLDSYTKNFFSDSEQNAMSVKTLTAQFAALGLQMPSTKAGFRALVDSLSSSGLTGQELAVKVLGLADAFSSLSDSTDSLIQDATSNLTDAYNAQSQTITDLQTKFTDFTKSLGDFKDSLLTGDLSILDVASQYQVQKAKFEATLQAALGGDVDAIGAFQDVSTAFLTASRANNASGDQYTADFQRVLDMTTAVQSMTSTKADVATQQLDALNQQVAGLITVNQSVMSVTDAVNALTALLAAGVNAGASASGSMSNILPITSGTASTADSKSYVASASTNADLATQVAALTAEVAALRADQAAQTSALIAANHDSNMQNAATIVDGTAAVASSTAYAERAQASLV